MRKIAILIGLALLVACGNPDQACPASEALSGWNGAAFSPNTYSTGTYYCDTIITADLKPYGSIWFTNSIKVQRWGEASITATFQTRCMINGKMWVGLDSADKTKRKEALISSQILTISSRMAPGVIPFYIVLAAPEETTNECPIVIKDIHTFFNPDPPQTL